MSTVLFDSILLEHVANKQPGIRAYLRGMSEAFNLSGNTSRQFVFGATPDDADRIAIGNDWFCVGRDLDRAIQTVTG